MAKQTFEPATTKQTLNRVTAKSMPFDWSINPYRGCTHGCSFCYARAFQSFLGRDAEDEFQNRIIVKENAAEALEAQLSKNAKKYSGDLDAAARHIGWVALGTATDPYQPVEGKARITRECLKVLAKYRIMTSITTRSPLILRDRDILAGMNYLTVNISIGTLRADITRKLEPGSPLPAKRLEAVEGLTRHGISAGAIIAPILPCLTDAGKDLELVVAAIKNRGASFAYAGLLRLTPDVKAWYLRTLETHFPHLLPAYNNLYSGAYASRAYSDHLMEKVSRLLERYELSSRPTWRAEPRESQPPAHAEQLEFSF
ncbi:radical SAM protein [Paenibacillus sp. sptzw28]|uniref:SPL family radical SAM protein n=1 Tax=Paenibacillus sp. sptzw28 TaxID=715179 RepID=UPI001C6E1242|nr:radical SAM protein [Paenibacillus sp. sptzw28]QYR21476.1 radical SAM protein [Paenibacillus sp. sptzw28]